ncbi:FecCD family ABC transporter permease [Motilibacter deserti]|uniref:Iron chelate uptake ABC transporter family permease subunit n=1 Tax=Motilibacter deserti TaxID=2714956 RepID=A0ABX0GW63_9ACTN|nr:iron chelate uptake ABC transporter family permease subunit [Motilibacter deserti]NHC14768.1 iron chelate uptake ABC transporter family permease subunit [Motilibacter deserti]
MTTSSSLAAEPTALLVAGRSRWLGPAVRLGAGVGLLLVSCAVAVCIGAADLSVEQVARSVAAHLGLGTSPLAPLADSVVWQLRLPRVLLAAAVGAALALCGCVLQALTRNVLADPYLLGISSGASAGAVAVLLLGLGAATVGLAGGAFLGGLLAFALVVLLVGSGVGTSITRVVLTGVAVGQLFAAVSALLLMASGDAQTVRGVTYWLLGSLSGARWSSVALVVALVVVGGLVLWSRSAALDAFTFGADAAASLGVDVARTRWLLFVTTALVTAGAVAVSGAIAFVGLVLPHAMRRLVGTAHARLLPTSAVAGAVFLVWADALARSAFAPQEVPVGVVTALVGAPALLLVLRSVAR